MKFDETDFERRLKTAMRREPAPPDFAAKVLARTRGNRRAWWRGAGAVAIAAMLVLAVLIPISERRQAERAEIAKEQTLQALSIANMQLRLVKEKIQRNRGDRR